MFRSGIGFDLAAKSRKYNAVCLCVSLNFVNFCVNMETAGAILLGVLISQYVDMTSVKACTWY